MLSEPQDFQARPRPAVPTLLTVRQFSEKHPAFSQGSLRGLIFQARPRYSSKAQIPGNGMQEAGVIVHVGKRVLLDETAFFTWLDGQQRRKAG